MYTEQYDRAKFFLPSEISKHIQNLQIVPHWCQDGTSFWYKKDLSHGFNFFLVNCATEQEDLLFDHKMLAELLSNHFNQQVSADEIPIIDAIVTNQHEIQINLFDQWLSFDTKNKILSVLANEVFYPTHCAGVMNRFSLYPPINAKALLSPCRNYLLNIENYNLKLTNLNSGIEKLLTQDGEKDYSYATTPDSSLSTVSKKRAGIKTPPVAIWSPNSKYFVTHQLDQRKVEELFLIQNVPTDGSLRPILHRYKMPFAGDENIPTTQLFIFNTETGAQLSIDTPPLNIGMLGSAIEMGYVWWSQDSNRLYFLRENRGYTELQLCVADVITGQVKTLITEQAEDYTEPSPLLFWQQYTHIIDKLDTILWLSEKTEWRHIYLYSANDGHLFKQLTDGEFNVREILHINTNDQWIYFTASGREKNIDPYYRLLYRIQLDGSSLELLTPEPADHTINFAPTGNYFIDNYSTLKSIPIAKLRHCDGITIKTIAEANFKSLLEKNWTFPEPFSVKADDNTTDIFGAIYRPTNFDPNKTYPIINFVYPSTQLLATSKTYHFDPPAAYFNPWLPQTYAELGFIVVTIDGRGTPLRSKSFHHRSYANLQNPEGHQDHIVALKQLAKKYQYIDITRVGIIGSSQGGYAAARAIMEFPEFYKVGVAISGNYDLRCYLALWGEKYQGLTIDERYDDYANLGNVENLSGKLLLIHGELDDNVHPCSTLGLVDKLIKADKDFDFLLIPNVNHACLLSSPYTIRRTWKYFLDHL